MPGRDAYLDGLLEREDRFKNNYRLTVMSGLSWRSGFDWIAVALLVAAIIIAAAGQEAARAERQGREFSPVNACWALAYALVGERQTNIDAMTDRLVAERGGYFAE